MIEINLVPGKKDFRLPEIMGIDLNHFNLKMLAIFVLIHLLTVPIGKDLLEGNLQKQRLLEEDKNKKLEQAITDGKASKEVQDKVDLLNQQEKKLKGKLDVVKQILKIKKNPLGIMLFITKNIPQDLWLTKLEIDSDNLEIEGGSTSYKGIGIFIDSLQGAIFFGSSVKLLDSKTTSDEKTGRRTEVFKIGAQISRYE
jgi:Tfp pilus assembly protein PilN